MSSILDTAVSTLYRSSSETASRDRLFEITAPIGFASCIELGNGSGLQGLTGSMEVGHPWLGRHQVTLADGWR